MSPHVRSSPLFALSLALCTGLAGGCFQNSQDAEPINRETPITVEPLPLPAPTDSNSEPVCNGEELKRANFFATKVEPILARSCSAGSCHAKAIEIDLRSYPFDAKGSYTWDTIVSELGESFDPLDAQKIIVRELIKSVVDDYMPPTREHPGVRDSELNDMRQWLDYGLPTADLCTPK